VSFGRRRWRAARQAHHDAVYAFARTALAIPEDRWHAARGEGKWSPAQETLHVARAYEVAIDEVETGVAMRPRVKPGRARLLRWFYLPYLLRTGRFPAVAAPVEMRPNEVEVEFFGPTVLVERVCERAMACEEALERADELRPGVRLTHPYFGALRPLPVLRLLTVHTAHHTRQLQREGTPVRPTVA
jgi:hypothetical protein